MVLLSGSGGLTVLQEPGSVPLSQAMVLLSGSGGLTVLQGPGSVPLSQAMVLLSGSGGLTVLQGPGSVPLSQADSRVSSAELCEDTMPGLECAVLSCGEDNGNSNHVCVCHVVGLTPPDD